METTLAFKMTNKTNGTEVWQIQYLPTLDLGLKMAELLNKELHKPIYIGKGYLEHREGRDVFEELKPFGMQMDGKFNRILSNAVWGDGEKIRFFPN